MNSPEALFREVAADLSVGAASEAGMLMRAALLRGRRSFSYAWVGGRTTRKNQ